MFCPRCGRDNPPSAKYCNECGFALQEIHSILIKSEGTVETPNEEIAGATGTSIEQVIPVKKDDPKKQYVQSTTQMPDGFEETIQQPSVTVQPVPEPERGMEPVSAQPSIPVTQHAVPEPHQSTTPAMIRNPSLAVALSLIPGLGQVYNGNLIWGLILFFASLIGLLIFIIPGVCIWIYSIYDAYRTAEKINRGQIAFNQQKKN